MEVVKKSAAKSKGNVNLTWLQEQQDLVMVAMPYLHYFIG